MYFDITKPACIVVAGGERFPIRIVEVVQDPFKNTEITASVIGGALPKGAFVDHLNNATKIKNVIFNDPATIVFWTDGSKTVVKVQDGETFDPEKGLAMAIAKKHFGNEGNYCNHLKKWIDKYNDEKAVIDSLLAVFKPMGDI